jgi:DNA repair protein RecO (recombination protein O)
LYYFIEDAFMHLDESEGQVLANYPLFFSLHLAGFFGLRIEDVYSEQKSYLDLEEGVFSERPPSHRWYLEGDYSQISSLLLRVRQPLELAEIELGQETRRVLLRAYLNFYILHIPEFGEMRTLPVLQAIWGG